MAKLNPVDASTTEKKPHPFSKEGRALRAELQQPQAIVPEAPSISRQPDLSDIMRKLEQLEAENKEMKEKFVPASVKGHEINNDPKQFSYKMRGGVPVIDWKGFKKDPTKDFEYKNDFGSWIHNQYVTLSLADGTTIEVEINEFGNHHTKSDRQVALDQHGETIHNESLQLVKTLTFDTPTFGKFTIPLSLAN